MADRPLPVIIIQSKARSGFAVASQASTDWRWLIDDPRYTFSDVVGGVNISVLTALAKAFRSITSARAALSIEQPERLPSWVLSFYSDPRDKAPRSSLRRLLSEMATLLGVRDFAAINVILAKVDWTQLPPAIVMGLVRSTAVARDHLPAWATAARAALSELNSRGLPAESIMIGLVEKSDGSSDSRTA